METQTLFKRTKHIWKNDEDSYLGFLSMNFFESTDGNRSIDDVLEAKLLSNKYDKPISEIEDSLLKYEGYDQFGPLDINQMNANDFQKINFFELNKEIDTFWSGLKNGDDWPIFQSNWNYFIEQLGGIQLKHGDFYFINADNARKELFTQENFYAYFLGGVCIDKDANEVVVFYLGED